MNSWPVVHIQYERKIVAFYGKLSGSGRWWRYSSSMAAGYKVEFFGDEIERMKNLIL
jgi:hypothetical protein